jgi:hypothetical protein
MKLIPKEFEGRGEVKGITFKEVKRDGLLRIYERSDGYYEVIRINIQKETNCVIKGTKVHFEGGESYPSANNWDGSCVSNLEKATQIFNDKKK